MFGFFNATLPNIQADLIMDCQKMTERIVFLKRTAHQNPFGEMIEKYEQMGKGWAFIRFKKMEEGNEVRPPTLIYEMMLQKPIPPFHRVVWRNQHYELKSGLIIDRDYHSCTALIQWIKNS